METQAVLEDIYFLVLYGGVTMLNVVVALYLLLRRANAIAPEVTSPVRLRRWAAAFFLVCGVSHVLWLLFIYHPSESAYAAVCGMDMLMFIPTMAGVMLSMLQDRFRPVWPVAVTLIPVVILVILCVIRGDTVLYAPLSVYVVSLYMLFMLYMFFTVRRYGRWLRDNYADLEHKEIWQSLLVLAVFMLFFLLYSTTTDNLFSLYLLQIDNILIAALLLWRVETLQQLTDVAQQAAELQEEVRTSSATPAIPANIGPLLKIKCEDGQLYLQHDLTLSNLAQSIGTNRYYLSQHFAQQGITYNAYISGLRIRHFVNLYHKAVAEKEIFTAQKLAFDSGFHSYSTFSAAFKQNMGTTVTAWMRSNQE